MGTDTDQTTAMLTPADPAMPRAESLAAGMAAAWAAGDKRGADAWLADHPEVAASPRAALRVIYEELCLREEAGEPADPSDFRRRFARWADGLEVLLDCHRLLEPAAAVRFPEPGETLCEFRLLAELGRGANGRVFRAREVALAGRPVVLKVSPSAGEEHLTLARLQHTHIVPLYSVRDVPGRDLRLLCMPDLGGAPLDRTLAGLRAKPPGLRTAADLAPALGRLFPEEAGGRGRAYARAVAWVGACLAEALRYAHDRGVLHLDLKPSNVLLTADGQPMLLDFHLARGPVPAGANGPVWLGGTPAYMSPEQRAAFADASAGRPLSAGVDGRSDVYSLGLLLRESLTGSPPVAGRGRLPWPRHVPPGLRAIVDRCLAGAPAARYPDAGALADDLRREVDDLPLRGVAIRNPRERWARWRRRRPHALGLAAMKAAVLAAALALGLSAWSRSEDASREARAALEEGQVLLREGRYAEAVRVLEGGRERARGRGLSGDLAGRAEASLRRARWCEAADRLHAQAERLRYLYGNTSVPPAAAAALEVDARAAWDARHLLLRDAPAGPEAQRLRADLLDLAIVWTDCRARLAAPATRPAARREALATLAEAEELFGPSPVLARERQAHAEALGLAEVAREAELQARVRGPGSAWEDYALGRWWLARGGLAEADAALDRAVERDPRAFWPWFWKGLCAHRRGRFGDAVTAFTVCVALNPSAECYYNRALASAAAGDRERAREDLDRSLALDPGSAAALLNRGSLACEGGRLDEAATDYRSALEHGADPAAVHYNLALVQLARDDRAGARASLELALRHRPSFPDAERLLERMGRGAAAPASTPARMVAESP